MLCKKCGIECQDTLNFCPNCGEKIIKEPVSSNVATDSTIASTAQTNTENLASEPALVQTNLNQNNKEKSVTKQDHSFIKIIIFLIFLYFIYQLFSVFGTIPEESNLITIVTIIGADLLPKLLRLLIGYIILVLLYYKRKVNIALAILRVLLAIVVIALMVFGEDIINQLKLIDSYLNLNLFS